MSKSPARATQSPITAVGFDLDGTLVDTSADLAAAVNHALALAGRPPLAPASVIPMIGGGAKAMLEQGLAASGGVEPAAFKPLYRAMLAYYADHVAVASQPYPGALAMLDALDARDIRYGVVTNKFEGLARALLGQLGMADRMAAIIGADTFGTDHAKPAPTGIQALVAACGGGRAVFVGDSSFDVMAAQAAGVISVAVSFGFHHGDIAALAADHIIDQFDELPELVARL